MRNFTKNSYIKMGFDRKNKNVMSIITKYCDIKNPHRVKEKLELLTLIDSRQVHQDVSKTNKLVKTNTLNL